MISVRTSPSGVTAWLQGASVLLSWWGDVLLIPGRRAAFAAGLASFLAGHLAFAGRRQFHLVEKYLPNDGFKDPYNNDLYMNTLSLPAAPGPFSPKAAEKSAVAGFEFLGRLDPPATLAEIKQSKLFDDWALVRQGRLSTMAAPEKFVEWMRKKYPKVKI